VPVLLEEYNEQDLRFVAKNKHLLERVGRVESVRPLACDEEAPQSATALLGKMRLLVPMAGLIDTAAEKERLGKLRDKATADLKNSESKLSNEKFVNNAPEAVVTQERERVASFKQQLEQFDEQLVRLQSDD
jgi:valyl-tRNA synthetase